MRDSQCKPANLFASVQRSGLLPVSTHHVRENRKAAADHSRALKPARWPGLRLAQNGQFTERVRSWSRTRNCLSRPTTSFLHQETSQKRGYLMQRGSYVILSTHTPPAIATGPGPAQRRGLRLARLSAGLVDRGYHPFPEAHSQRGTPRFSGGRQRPLPWFCQQSGEPCSAWTFGA